MIRYAVPWLLFIVLSCPHSVFAGWFPNSQCTGDRVNLRSEPDPQAPIVGIARKDCPFDLIYIKGEWGRVQFYKSNEPKLINLSLVSYSRMSFHYTAWINIKFVQYGQMHFFKNNTLGENMLLEDETFRKYQELMSMLTGENNDEIKARLIDFSGKYSIEPILLSNIRDTFIASLVTLFKWEDKRIFSLVRSLLLSPSCYELGCDRLRIVWPRESSCVFRTNALDFLYRLSDHRRISVDADFFFEALVDPELENIYAVRSYFGKFSQNNAKEMMTILNLEKLVNSYAFASLKIQSRIKSLISMQLHVINKGCFSAPSGSDYHCPPFEQFSNLLIMIRECHLEDILPREYVQSTQKK